MGAAKQIIEINGKRYDTETGRLVNASSHSAAKPNKHAGNHSPQSTVNGGAVLDGFVRRPTASPQRSTPHEAKKPEPHRSAASKANREPQHSKTLMRSGLKKPEHKHSKPAHSAALPTLGAGSVERINRAKQTQKSSQITKFSKKPNHTSTVVKKTAALEVAMPSKATTAASSAPTQSKPATKQFEHAVKHATSHKQKFIPEAGRGKARKLLISGAAVLSVLLFGFLAFQMVPTIKVKLAGTRAGFDASLPNYSPAGFGLSGNIATNSGEVTLTYNSRTDDKNYKLTQTPSNWTSQALLNNFVIPANKPYQTYEEQGKTVFIYDNSNATWIDGGIWYKLEGNANLTSDQLLRIANGV